MLCSAQLIEVLLRSRSCHLIFGKIAGQIDALFVGDTDRKLRNFQETMAGIATVSISLPQETTFHRY